MSDMVMSVKLTENGEIPLPKELRLALGLLPRQALRLRRLENRIVVEKEQIAPESLREQAVKNGRLERFLALRGALADDTAFDRAIEFLERAWQAWTPPVSA